MMVDAVCVLSRRKQAVFEEQEVWEILLHPCPFMWVVHFP